MSGAISLEWANEAPGQEVCKDATRAWLGRASVLH